MPPMAAYKLRPIEEISLPTPALDSATYLFANQPYSLFRSFVPYSPRLPVFQPTVVAMIPGLLSRISTNFSTAVTAVTKVTIRQVAVVTVTLTSSFVQRSKRRLLLCSQRSCTHRRCRSQWRHNRQQPSNRTLSRKTWPNSALLLRHEPTIPGVEKQAQLVCPPSTLYMKIMPTFHRTSKALVQKSLTFLR